MPSFVNKPVVNKSQNFNGNEKQQARKNIGAASEEELISHVSDKSNPHEVTAEQIGAYTKEQVDGFIRNWSGYVVIPFGQQKPSASDAQLGKIYLVQVSNDPDVRDQYEEWISDGTAWSLIGTMAIDLSPYDKIVDAEAREKAISDALAAHISDTTKHITEAERTKWNEAVHPSDLAKVATTGSYNDLTGKPTIPADSGLVHLTGTETITGVKNFTSASGTFHGKCYKDVNGRWIVPENGTLVCDLGAPYLCEWVTVKSSYGSQLEYIQNENVLYEKTFDGESWETYSVPEINHKKAWSLGNSEWGYIAIGSSAGQRGIRITITAPTYTWLDQLYMYAGRGSTYQKIIIEKQLNSSGDWLTVTESGYSGGDPAHYVLRFPFITFNTAQASQYGKIRITILDREQTTRDHSILKIGLFGGYPYYTPKEYTITIDKNFQFYGTLYARNGTGTNYRVFDASQIIPIASGGTGANSAAAARTNLGLGSIATKNNVTDSDISGTIADSHIASASTWNGKQEALSFTTPAEITEILGGLE